MIIRSELAVTTFGHGTAPIELVPQATLRRQRTSPWIQAVYLYNNQTSGFYFDVRLLVAYSTRQSSVQLQR